MRRQFIRVRGTRHYPNGYYGIDPDMAREIEPFEVFCSFPYKTVIKATSASVIKATKLQKTKSFAGPHAQCFDLEYGDISKAQLRALTEVSGFCSQPAVYKGRHAPFTTHSYWVNREGETMKGFAGNAGGEKCACGMTQRCDGGVADACHSDVNDFTWKTDEGVFIDKSVLPVSRMCIGYDTSGRRHRPRDVYYKIRDLTCAPNQFDIDISCQRRRDRRQRKSGSWLVDPDGPGGNAPFTAYCEMTAAPPVGVTVITHTNPGCQSVPAAGATSTYTYNAADVSQLQALVQVSTYCTQRMTYDCTNASLDLSGSFGWYASNGTKMAYWAGNTGGTGCGGGTCNCNILDGERRSDGGELLDKSVLPVSSVRLSAAPGQRCLLVGELRCYTIYKNCEQIRLYRAKYNPNRNNVYAVDPDQAGGFDIFGAKCDYRTDRSMGISVMDNAKSQDNTIPISSPGSRTDKIVYRGYDNYRQLHGLTEVSAYCAQVSDREHVGV
ncbi:hypothetical protein LSAT2_012814 [Lamellibrachia satsuma]|nr:hypothetical protein LSAT2_012814 [Lamellibrachia satsuma]